MSGKREKPYSMSSNEREADLHRAECSVEEEDVYAQLAQKEKDLILAAELGKALLDSNQELQSRYDQMVDEYMHKVEVLQQEKYDLHLELAKMGAEYQNAIKDLQDDMVMLRKQVRTNDELQLSERERSRSLREAQQNSDYLMEQVKKASLREDELMKELEQLKIKSESSCATIKDQIDHISMLRDQVEYLSEKLRELNKKLQEIEEEKDILINTLETTQENVQILKSKLSEQEVKIQHQANEIEELQESNAELLQQLQQQSSLQHQHRALYHSSRSNINTKHNNKKQNPNNLYFELNQEKQKQAHCYSQSFSHQQDHQQKQGDQPTEEQDQPTHTDKNKEFNELSFFSELALGDNGGSHNSPSLVTAFSSKCHYNRSLGDCSQCCVPEGSRKRHHQNVGEDSDDDEGSDNGPKQSLYSKSAHSKYPLADSVSSTNNSNRSQVSYLVSSKVEVQNSYTTDVSRHSLPDLTQKENTDVHAVLNDSLSSSESESFLQDCLSHNMSLNGPQEKAVYGNLPSQLDHASYMSGENNEKSLFSELSPFAYEFIPRQQSLFSELSSQLYDDKHGTGSDSSSSCMLGVFDFSGSDAQDVDKNSNESLNQSMEMRSRIENDMSYVSDWYYMTPVTSEMLEEDDFECDDDDFLIGNMAGTTLSISDSDHGLRYNYHGYVSRENVVDQKCATYTMEQGHKDHNKQQEQLSEACRQLQELVIRAQGEDKTHGDFVEADTDVLLYLVAEMRACIDKMSAQKAGQLQDTDILTTMNVETGSSCGTQSVKNQEEQKHHQIVADQRSLTENVAETRTELHKLMRRSKSSSSLI